MINIGITNHLTITRFTPNGAYLSDGTRHEVLLPARYVTEDMKTGTELDVFVYTDSEDRPVATTDTPYAQAGEFAYLEVADVNRIGAFLNWGVMKHLLVPFSEQRSKMHTGGIYLVYVYLDNNSGRVVASAKVNKFLDNVYPSYHRGNKVSCLVTEHTPIGYKVIVDNKHRGMIYDNELYRPLEIQQTITAYVKTVRDDGKIDLTLTAPSTEGRIRRLEDVILKMIRNNTMTLTEHSTPEEIKDMLHCSKRDFKKTVGALYKARKITIADDGTYTIAH